ncbi:MAG: virulence protein RhuM/Fic/DOC family protein [Bacteroidales bacterium]|nr:virulence protein RhuM/Fic/DOC family protein [Bacteroidales bacterium]
MDIDNGKIVIYNTDDGKVNIDVKLENDTVWLTQSQMANLFDKDRTVISRHIRNIYKECELDETSTCANFAHVGIDNDQTYITTIYNLDVIISVGYRVKSKRGIQFRIWANKIIKDYIIKGYAVNDKILHQNKELKQLINILSNTLYTNTDVLPKDLVQDIVNIVQDYTYALDTLDNYDYQRLSVNNTTAQTDFIATYNSAKAVITTLKEKFGGSDLFGHEKDGSFKSSIGQIYQTFGGVELYPSVEEKAAMLLYLVVKNHSFSDGNKRIAAALFLWFLNANGILYNKDKTKRIADNALVALTLMIAESRPEEKDIMVKVVVNLINKDNK